MHRRGYERGKSTLKSLSGRSENSLLRILVNKLIKWKILTAQDYPQDRWAQHKYMRGSTPHYIFVPQVFRLRSKSLMRLPKADRIEYSEMGKKSMLKQLGKNFSSPHNNLHMTLKLADVLLRARESWTG
jgi:hypothetical protein